MGVSEGRKVGVSEGRSVGRSEDGNVGRSECRKVGATKVTFSRAAVNVGLGAMVLATTSRLG